MLDHIYFREGDDNEPLLPASVKISNKNAAVTEVVMFLIIFGYLCAIYGVVIYLQSLNFGSKIEASDDESRSQNSTASSSNGGKPKKVKKNV